jgi:N-carbamoylputrescine amidase
MALKGAEVLLYLTAIGSEPQDAGIDSAGHWQRAMQGSAASNIMPLVASNRIGVEPGQKGTEITFYGSSFIADSTGAKVAEADRQTETVLTATFDLDAVEAQRQAWGLFRDRRPELYGPLLTLDGAG